MVISAKLATDSLSSVVLYLTVSRHFGKKHKEKEAILSTVLGRWSLLEALLGSGFQTPTLPIVTASLGLHLDPYLLCTHDCPLLHCWLGGRVQGMMLHFFMFIIKGCPKHCSGQPLGVL